MKFDPKDYETVKSRKLRFYNDYPDGRIIVKPISDKPLEYALFIVELFKNKEDQEKNLIFATGTALEIRDTELSTARSGASYESVNYSSWTENCEESAVGRALDNAGYSGNKKCSLEEMQKAKAFVDRKKDTPTILDLIHEAVKTYGDKMREYLVELNIESPDKLAKLSAMKKIEISELVSNRCKEIANEKKDTTTSQGKPHYSDDNVPMGKHKGKKWSEVSNSYLEWVIENVEKGKPLRIASEKEYDLRNQADVSAKDTPKNEDFPF